MDFVNISALDNEISNSNSENQIPNPIEEERNTNSMSNTTSFNEPQPQNNTQLANNNNISKVKYATAIKLAKDAIKNIKLAGYEVALEELETPNDYQIIIKVQK